ncbi:E3 SUMO-protein ligase ZBED1-like [Acanthochromis polyacanthus]|uniref:E3 SUMO-protein ligase ZBED1-like n=1 Tax=Acanthochromis polyacanthus TaxID=80966 RepID=UPI002234D19A|nr:E3 SUMO-protein ligase ZBED1-like [Acanthochromis polyacanthus]
MAQEELVENRVLKDAPQTFKADIWQHFGFYEVDGKLDKTHAVCKTCHAKIKHVSNTTNYKNHVDRWHPELNSKAKTVEPSQLKIYESLTSVLSPTSERAKRITRAVGCFIAKDLRPYSVVECKGFRHMIKTLEPRYTLPTRATFTDTVVPTLYKETKAKVMESLSKASHVAITSDAWTSVATESYVTITAHCISEDWQIVGYVLQTRSVYESHTGAHMAKLLLDAVEEWQLAGKGVVLVTDNAANMLCAAEIGKFPHVKCFAHTLNLAAQRALKLPTVARLLGRVRRISAYFHRSTKALHLFEENQKVVLKLKTPLKLITDVSTRWNSAHDMIERFLQLQAAVHATLLSPALDVDEDDIVTLSRTDLANAEEAVKILKPMKEATQLMEQARNPTVSLIAPLHAQILQRMADTIGDPPVIRDVKTAVRTDLLKRYSTDAEKKILLRSSALDPRFKLLPFLPEEERLDVYAAVTSEAASLEEVEDRRRGRGSESAPGGTGSSGTQEELLSVDDDVSAGPSAPKKRRTTASLLESLLGDSFSGNREPAIQVKTPMQRRRRKWICTVSLHLWLSRRTPWTGGIAMQAHFLSSQGWPKNT